MSASDRSYSDMRWSEATKTDEFITVPAWSRLNSKNAGRSITAGLRTESRQVFYVLLPPSPKKIDEDWSAGVSAEQDFEGKKLAPEDAYSVRYRVRFASEYSPTPTPQPSASAE